MQPPERGSRWVEGEGNLRMVSTYATPFPYYGGKTIYLDALLSRFPKHKCYVEPFGGSASVLLNKAESDCEVYNDIDSDLVNFFKVLRDPVKAEELYDVLYLTPFSREEYLAARYALRDINKEKLYTDVERARMWFLMLRQSFSATPGTGGWSVVKYKSKTQGWYDAVSRLEIFTRRLMKVHIENQSFEKIFSLYDGPETLFYVDPPYTMKERSGGKAYRNEITPFQHTVLLHCIQKCKGMVILSGYHNEKYDKELAGWQIVDIQGKAFSSPAKGEGTREDRTEVLWIKPNAVKQQGLWQAVPERLIEQVDTQVLI